MKKLLFTICCLMCATLFGQDTSVVNCFRIHLSDKNNSPYSIDEPSAFLSPRAIDNRTRFGIAITEEDLPVNPNYIEQILNVDENIKLLSTSKWSNRVVIYCPDSMKLNELRALSFIDSIVGIANYQIMHNLREPSKMVEAKPNNAKAFDYGEAQAQIQIHNGDKLHDAGYRGEGQLIVVIDGGWENFNTLTHTALLYEHGQILGTRTLLPEDTTVYNDHEHGTNVTSIMALNADGEFVGTAPKANYFFIKSEVSMYEQWIEEDFLAQALEIADSLGADVVNISLGYRSFDFPVTIYITPEYVQFHSISGTAANMATSKGVVVCTAAGNDGDAPWHYLCTPAAAEHVLAVGAITADSVHAPFSSFGFGGDLVKPDVVSVGRNIALLSADDNIHMGEGTSFASPNLTGLVACLRQALPDKNAREIMQLVREAGHLFNNPNDSLGYGIPDFYKIYVENTSDPISISTYKNALNCSIFPNPASDQINITTNLPLQNVSVQLFDMQGKIIFSKELGSLNYFETLSLKNVRSGLYFLQIKTANELIIKKIVKN